MSIGYDNLALNIQLELDLTLEEMVGTLAYCRSKRDIVGTLHGVPVWTALASGLPTLEFDLANPDWVDVPAAATGLNFTAGDFSLAVWAHIDALATSTLMCRGVANTDGWLLQVDNTGRIGVATFQAAATQTTYSTASIAINTWYLIGATRSGADILTYLNGNEITDAPDTHVNPLTSARELHIGVLDDEASSPWDGGMYRPRAWARALTAMEMLQLYRMEEARFP